MKEVDLDPPVRSRATRRESLLEVLLEPRQRPTVTANEAFRLLGIDRNTGYKAIKEGTFPVQVVRIGRVIRVPTLPLVRLLMDVTSDRQQPGEE